jgi:hypothetical protein
MASQKLYIFAERLFECLSSLEQDEILDTLTEALDSKLTDTPSISQKVRKLVEEEYDLDPTVLDNSFNHKDRNLTEPKFMWVVVTLHMCKGDRKETKRLIGNGVTKQKIYTCNKHFSNLEDIYTEKDANRIKATFEKLIQSYE